MVTYTENIDSLRQIYDIRAVNSLAEFLLPGHSLCIHHPEWRDFEECEFVDASKVGGTGGRVRLVKIRGRSGSGKPDELLLGICGPDDQGYYRHKLESEVSLPFRHV